MAKRELELFRQARRRRKAQKRGGLSTLLGFFRMGSGSTLQSGRYRLTEYCVLPEWSYDVTGTCTENPNPRDTNDRNLIVKGENEPTFLISYRNEEELEGSLRRRATLRVFGGAEALEMIGVTILIGMVLVLFVVGIFIYLITIYNSLVRLKNDINKSWSNIDVLLKQRHDKLPKLIETCKGYMQYEQKTFQMITEARTAFMRASSVGQKAQADNMISGALKSLFAVAENYPELKANNNFLQLQKRISELEERIADRREFFNDTTNTFNIRIAQLPDVFIAKMLSLEPRDLFKVSEEERRDVEMKLA